MWKKKKREPMKGSSCSSSQHYSEMCSVEGKVKPKKCNVPHIIRKRSLVRTEICLKLLVVTRNPTKHYIEN